jgi:hypothetical protein
VPSFFAAIPLVFKDLWGLPTGLATSAAYISGILPAFEAARPDIRPWLFPALFL